MDIKKHALYQLNRTDIFDSMHNTKATSQRFQPTLTSEPHVQSKCWTMH